MAAFLVNFAALVVHLICRPWVNNRLDTTQAYSILAQTVTIFYSIMLFIMQNSADQSVGSLGKRFIEILIIVSLQSHMYGGRETSAIVRSKTQQQIS